MIQSEKLELLRKIDLRKFLKDTVGTHFRGFNARCPHPDHEDRHPSFAVYLNKKKKTWHWCCYSCCNGHYGQEDARGHKIFGNDIIALIRWLSDYDGSPHVYTFFEAVKIAAEYAGLDVIEQETPKDAAIRKQLALNYAVAEGCNKTLLTRQSPAYRYLIARGLDDNDITEFKLGTDGSRVVFPIRNVSGEVRGFSWRVLSTGPCPQKYINSRNDEIFQKGRILYGMDKLDPTAKQIYITEGQMDVIAAYKNGLRNVVASMGTSFTKEHIEALKKCCPDIDNLVFIFDGDTAGQAALKRSAEMARDNGYFAKCVLLKDNMDLFDFAMDKKEDFVSEIENMTRPYFYEQFKDDIETYDTMILNFQSKVLKKYSNVNRHIQNERERGMLMKFLDDRFDVRIRSRDRHGGNNSDEEDYYQSS